MCSSLCRQLKGLLAQKVYLPEGKVIAVTMRVQAPERPTSRVRRRPIGIDLFAGVGGMSLGFEQAGFDIVASVEYDPVHAAVHEFNFPLTKVLCADVGRVSADQLREAAHEGFIRHGHAAIDWNGAEIDVIFGGPPCQGFSTMGKRDVSDDRNKLGYKFADLIGEIQPRYFVMENVPGMAAGGHASILSRLIARFKKHGYDVAVRPENVRKEAILNAANFGVPQDRKRLILLGAREGLPLPAYPLPTVRRAPKRIGDARITDPLDMFLSPGPTVGQALLDLPDLDAFEELLLTDEIQLNKRDFDRMTKSASEYVKRLRGIELDPEDFSHPRRWNPKILTSSMRTIHTDESIRRFRATKQGETEAISRFYRLDIGGLCNTLRAGTGSERGAYTSPRPLHPTLARVLSVREAARLHSFPDWFRLHRTKWSGFRSIGNAVPPLFGRAIGRAVIAALHVEPIRPTAEIEFGDPYLLTVNRLQAAAHFGADERHIPKVRKRLVNV
jgi:DNA (cytosine-5)-methyltransferase 1